MRNILSILSRILLVMAFVGSANATVTLNGGVDCTGSTPPNEVCVQDVLCDNGDCVITDNPLVQFNTSCGGVAVGNTIQFTASHANQGPDPICTWTVEDGSAVPLDVTIDYSDGLPVELTTFSVD